MKKHNNAGFSAIILIILIALIGGGAYYAGTLKSKPITTDVVVSTSTSTEEAINIPIKAPSSEKVEIPSDKKVYTSTLGVEFEIPKTLYAYDKLAFGSDITLLESQTRPKELTESCDCDGDLYYSTVRINAHDLKDSKEAAINEHGSVLYYKGITQQLLSEEDAKMTETFPPAVSMTTKAQVKLGKTFVSINKNGLKVVRQYVFSEMNGDRISVIYYVYVGNKVYGISGKQGVQYSATEDAVLANIAATFKVTK